MAALFHFSDRGDITTFTPRPVQTPRPRRPGQEWLNGPLVWAIDAAHQPLYLFPRDCPRILVWKMPNSTPDDIAKVPALASHPFVAFIETRWLDRLATTTLYRYTLPADTFEPLEDAGMHISHQPVTPSDVTALTNLPDHLTRAGTHLIRRDTFTDLNWLWDSSLRASGIRLHHAEHPPKP